MSEVNSFQSFESESVSKRYSWWRVTRGFLEERYITFEKNSKMIHTFVRNILNWRTIDRHALISVTEGCGHQCCHSVMKKTQHLPWKKTENSKNPRHTKCFWKSQNQTWNVRYWCMHIKLKVICIICIIFLTSSGLFLNIGLLTMHEVT